MFINETGQSDHLNESRVKYLTGNDTMSGRDLYESTINFKPKHKVLLRTNHKPTIRGTDLGIWRRIHYVPYLVTIAPDEQVELFRQTKLDPERPGILNWRLTGLKDYVAGGLKPPPIVSRATKEYRKQMDTVGQWVGAMCEPSPNGLKLFLSEIYEKYTRWAVAEFGTAESRLKLADALRARGYEEDHPQNRTRFKLHIRTDDDG